MSENWREVTHLGERFDHIKLSDGYLRELGYCGLTMARAREAVREVEYVKETMTEALMGNVPNDSLLRERDAKELLWPWPNAQPLPIDQIIGSVNEDAFDRNDNVIEIAEWLEQHHRQF